MSRYEQACAEACPWCAKGLPLCCGLTALSKTRRHHRDDEAVHAIPGGDYKYPCSAPNIDQFAESESARADALREKCEALEAERDQLRDKLEVNIRFLRHYLQENIAYIPDSDRSGHPHGWTAVQIPDWAVKQQIDAAMQAEATEEKRDA